jgi:hypothetical protein
VRRRLLAFPEVLETMSEQGVPKTARTTRA